MQKPHSGRVCNQKQQIMKVGQQKSAKPKPETANAITANVIRVINMTPKAVAYRINNMGVWDAKINAYRLAHTQKGIADVDAIYKGQAIKIEIKSGRDKQSDHQKAYQQEIERAGGIYIIIRSTDEFLYFWKQIDKRI